MRVELLPSSTPPSDTQFLSTYLVGDAVAIEPDGQGVILRQAGWKLMDTVADAPAIVMDIWACLLDGALAAHNPRLAASRDGLTCAELERRRADQFKCGEFERITEFDRLFWYGYADKCGECVCW